MRGIYKVGMENVEFTLISQTVRTSKSSRLAVFCGATLARMHVGLARDQGITGCVPSNGLEDFETTQSLK